MSAGFDDDRSFKNLSNREGLNLHRLSYFCQQALCPECPGKISYKKVKEKVGYDPDTKKFYGPQGDERKFEDWDPEFDSVQLKGDIQTKINTPEGSKCECFCHESKRKPRNASRYIMNELSESEKKKLR